MRRKSLFLARILALILLDLAAYYVSLFLAVFARTNVVNLFYRKVPPFIFSFQYFVSIWWIPLIFVSIVAFEKLYIARTPFWEESKSILKTTTITMLFVFFLISVRNVFGDISRLTLILLWLFLFLIMPFFRYWGKRFMSRIGLWGENVLILGAGEDGIATVNGLLIEKQLGYRIIGFLDDNNKAEHEVVIQNKTFKIYGKIKNFTKFVSMLDVSTVIIALPGLTREELSALTTSVQKYVKTVMVVPDLAGIAQMNTELHYLFMQKIFLLKINNSLKSVINRIVKRIFDTGLAILIFPFLLIAIGIFAIMIKLDSRGPVFIIQERMGKNKKPFFCVKFRTMFLNNDHILEEYLERNPEARKEWKKYKKLREYDPRVTKVGNLLRKTSMDELPQIFNVLKGEMSLVGPRPYLPREEAEMAEYVDVILLTTPGLSGLWQISGRNELAFEERLKLDTWYVQNWSLWLDIMILFKSVGVVLQKKGAY